MLKATKRVTIYTFCKHHQRDKETLDECTEIVFRYEGPRLDKKTLLRIWIQIRLIRFFNPLFKYFNRPLIYEIHETQNYQCNLCQTKNSVTLH